MSITVTVNGFAQVPDGMLVVPTSKLALIRWGLVCGRPWWISDPRYGRWTEWDAPPPDIGEVAGSELLELRRVICLLGAFLHEDRIGAPIETTDHFHALHGAGLEEAASRLDAAVAGQLAWSLLDVAALHHVGWTGPSLGISPDPEPPPRLRRHRRRGARALGRPHGGGAGAFGRCPAGRQHRPARRVGLGRGRRASG